MALKAGYKGFKKLLSPLKLFRPGELGIDNDALVEDLGPVFFPRVEQSIYGAYNALPGPTGTKTAQGVTYTEGDNDVITLSGASTAYSAYAYSTRTEKTFKLPVGEWKLIPRKTGTDDSTMSIGSGNAGDGSTGTYESWAYSTGNVVTFTVDSTKAGRYISCAIQIDGSKTANSTWQPMIVPADTPDDFPYVPYAMNNQQLTKKVAANVVDIKTDFKTALMGATSSTVTDVETALLSTYGDIMILNSRVNKATSTGFNFNVTVPYTVLPKTQGTVYASLHSPAGAGTASLGSGSLALRYPSDGATYVDITIVALMDVSSSANREANREADPDVKELIDEPVEKTTTKKTTKKTASADNNE